MMKRAIMSPPIAGFTRSVAPNYNQYMLRNTQTGCGTMAAYETSITCEQQTDLIISNLTGIIAIIITVMAVAHLTMSLMGPIEFMVLTLHNAVMLGCRTPRSKCRLLVAHGKRAENRRRRFFGGETEILNCAVFRRRDDPISGYLSAQFTISD